MMQDLVDFHNVATYTIVATSAGILFPIVPKPHMLSEIVSVYTFVIAYQS